MGTASARRCLPPTLPWAPLRLGRPQPQLAPPLLLLPVLHCLSVVVALVPPLPLMKCFCRLPSGPLPVLRPLLRRLSVGTFPAVVPVPVLARLLLLQLSLDSCPVLFLLPLSLLLLLSLVLLLLLLRSLIRPPFLRLSVPVSLWSPLRPARWLWPVAPGRP